MANAEAVDSENELALTALRLRGDDAQAFLQAQLTADLNALEQAVLQPAAWCNADGRVALVLLLGRLDDGFLLVVPAGVRPELERRIRLFRIGRKVEVEPQVAIEACTPADPAALGLSYAPDRAFRIASGRRDGHNAVRPDLLADDIRHGMPWIVNATSGRFLPQMLGLDRLGGLSYRKGCYPGQEVIARVHYRGRVTRRCVRFRLASAMPPAPGFEWGADPVLATVLYAAVDAPGQVRGLAVVPTEIDTADLPRLPGTDPQNRLEWLDTDAPQAYQER